MPPIPPPRVSGFTSSTPVPLYWCEYGDEDAPPLLLVHGGPGASHEYLLPQMLALSNEHRVICYDQRGGGRSRYEDDRETITWRHQVADLGAVARERGIEPLTLVGYSWGALLSMLYAIEAESDSVLLEPASLALIDPAPINRPYREQFDAEFTRRQKSPEIAALRAELAGSGLRERDPDAYRQRTFELSVAGYFADPRRAHDLTPFRVTGRVQQSIWASLGDFDLAPALEHLHLPAFVVHGRQDPIPLASSESAARALGTQCLVLEDCGHVPYVEQPSQLFPPLLSFLRERVPTPPYVARVLVADDSSQPHIAVLEYDGRRFNVTCRVTFDGIEYVGRLWFADESWDDAGVTDRGSLPGRSREEAIAMARRLTMQDLLLRYRRALAEKRRFVGLRRATDEILGKIRYLNQVAISMRAGLLDAEGAAAEIDLTERQLHEVVEKLKAFAGIET